MTPQVYSPPHRFWNYSFRGTNRELLVRDHSLCHNYVLCETFENMGRVGLKLCKGGSILVILVILGFWQASLGLGEASLGEEEAS